MIQVNTAATSPVGWLVQSQVIVQLIQAANDFKGLKFYDMIISF